MEDSLNGKVEETQEAQPQAESKVVVVEDVEDSIPEAQSGKVVEIDDSEPANRREISIVEEEFVESVEKILDGNGSKSSSRSSSDDEKEMENESPQAEDNDNNNNNSGKDDLNGVVVEEEIGEQNSSAAEIEEKKVVSSLVENTKDDVVPSVEAAAAAIDFVSKGIEETELPNSCDNNNGSSSSATTGVAIENTEETEQVLPKGIEDNHGLVSSEAVSNEATIENVHNQSSEVPENTSDPSVVSVTRPSLQPTSWRSCCGLFEVLRRSDR